VRPSKAAATRRDATKSWNAASWHCVPVAEMEALFFSLCPPRPAYPPMPWHPTGRNDLPSRSLRTISVCHPSSWRNALLRLMNSVPMTLHEFTSDDWIRGLCILPVSAEVSRPQLFTFLVSSVHSSSTYSRLYHDSSTYLRVLGLIIVPALVPTTSSSIPDSGGREHIMERPGRIHIHG
jgi:hypothetical protein